MDVVEELIRSSKLIFKNAEANIYIGNLLGKRVVIKQRVYKKYRHPVLDKRLRRLRTYREVSIVYYLLNKGYRVPTPLFSSLKHSLIVFNFIDGRKLSEVLRSEKSIEKERLIYSLGGIIGGIHNEGIVHGDPNLTNFILSSREQEIYIIDFGLSYWSSSPKDHALDLDVVRRSLQTVEADNYETLFNIFLDGYQNIYKNFDELVSFFNKLVKMGRYHEYR